MQTQQKPTDTSPTFSSSSEFGSTTKYLALLFSFLFLIFESIIRVITLALPASAINFCYTKSRTLFNSFSSRKYTTVSSSRQEKDIVAHVREADGFIEICEIWNKGDWIVEEHVVQTGDGYLLGLHRLRKKGHKDNRNNRNRDPERGNGGKKVVYLHHGLLMNSEVWVCLLEKERCLPFVLVEKGFDVWLGNNRGNKYSKKSIHHPSLSPKFWDFSMDEFAFHDIPDSINYILSTSKQKSLSYIGFSQGTAQAFATLSIHPNLNEKVDVFIALAPAMSPEGLSNPIVDALMKTSPNIMFLFFGRKSILSSTTFWQSILYPPIFVRVIDVALKFLFNWSGANISLPQKIAAYSKLYSFTSVKSVVHWFQIIRNKSFQMYDDDIQSPIAAFAGKGFYKVAKFPTRNITTPITLIYGGNDSLVDIDVMLRELPGHTVAKEVEHYEHLDFLWAKDVHKLVFPHVLEALEAYSTGGDKEVRNEFDPKKPVSNGNAQPSSSLTKNLTAHSLGKHDGLPSYSDDERDASSPTADAHGALPLPFSRSNSPAEPSVIGDPILDPPEEIINLLTPSSERVVSPEPTRITTPIRIANPQPDSRRSGSVSSTDGTVRNLFGPAGITLGTGRPSTAGVSTGAVVEGSPSDKRKKRGNSVGSAVTSLARRRGSGAQLQ
ncbi:alpha/beta-hydrolase [Choiromyces venosus 120613-1]|uniref:Alpha/beta-hydrolase n=1 Tax=Choiromyces venosus 120613-1 TaxID=1336337 RepID=A0A3N4K6E6_9PEZI|nr:alpha/beta-hydrolase [Choiromyces venosus 120613-1]